MKSLAEDFFGRIRFDAENTVKELEPVGHGEFNEPLTRTTKLPKDSGKMLIFFKYFIHPVPSPVDQ